MSTAVNVNKLCYCLAREKLLLMFFFWNEKCLEWLFLWASRLWQKSCWFVWEFILYLAYHYLVGCESLFYIWHNIIWSDDNDFLRAGYRKICRMWHVNGYTLLVKGMEARKYLCAAYVKRLWSRPERIMGKGFMIYLVIGNARARITDVMLKLGSGKVLARNNLKLKWKWIFR